MPLQLQSLAEWEAAGQADLLSVVIPAHNEEGHLAATVDDLVAALSDEALQHEILVVDDNSTDSTEAILKELSDRHPSVRYVINRPPNGFGFAVRTGLAEFRGACVAIVMADGSDSPADLIAFYRKWQEGYDCVFGNRFTRGGQVVGYPVLKYLLNRAGNWFIQLIFLMKYSDITNAFKLYGRNVVAGLQPLLAHHFNLTVELPLKAIVRGYSYAVVPNSWRNRKQGMSKFRIREMGSRYLFIILYCWLEKRLSRGDYREQDGLRDTQLQVWHR